MKILYFGDIIGKTGRAGVKKILPQLVEAHQPDLIIANAENIAHETGITPRTIAEMQTAGVEVFTSGNHVWDKPLGEELLQDANPIVIRPYNYGTEKSGIGFRELEKDGKKILVINMQGQAFMHDEVENPFESIDELLANHPPKNYDAIFVDFHAEATAEKLAFAKYLDGKVSVVVGSHTHVPTADAKIMENKTAVITDVGMNGARNSIIGFNYDSVLGRTLGTRKGRLEVEEEGPCDINAVLVTIGENREAEDIQLLQFTVEL